MGHKVVCLECYRVENRGTNLKIGKCPNCSQEMVFINHRFRPPKKTDKKGWELVKFLVSEGFPYQHIYQSGKSDYYKTATDNYVEWPKSLKDAKEFVDKYTAQKILSKYNKN